MCIRDSDILNPFPFRVERHNTRSSLPSHKSLRSQADAEAPDGFPEVAVIPHVAEVKLIDRRRSQRLRIAQAEQLGPAQIECVEPWNTRSTLRHRIWVVERVVVQEIVGRQYAPMTVVIEPVGALVVPQSLVVGRCREGVSGRIRLGNILQQTLRRRRPCLLYTSRCV